MEHYDIVQRAFDELQKSGDIYAIAPGSNQGQTIENQKAYLTRRAAYYLNLVDSTLGLLSKTDGNNVMGLSVDIIVKKYTGDFYDIATDVAMDAGYRVVQPVNAGMSNDLSLASRWVQPTEQLAGLADIPPVVIPPDIPPIPPSIPPEYYQKILDLLTTIIDNQTKIIDTMHLNDSDIMNKLNEIATKPITVTFPDYKSAGWITVVLHPVVK